MLIELLWFCGGLVLLGFGADILLKGAAGLALRFGIPPFIIGLTIVGFGTSAPELAVNLSAAWQGRYDVALGNVIGSNIANVGLILGLSALLAPLAVHMRLLKIETPLVIVAGVALWLLAIDGLLGRLDGALLLAGFVALMVYVYRSVRREPPPVREELAGAAMTRTAPWLNLLRVAAGLALLVYGASVMVESAVVIARLVGLSELLIGLTIVAVGTSLPELATSLLAARRGQTDIAVGNVLGSCLFNILLILGATAMLHPLPVALSLLHIEIPAMIAFSAVIYPMLVRDLCIQRREGAVLLAAYLAFLGFQVWYAFR